MAYNLEWRPVGGATTAVAGITDLFYDLTGLTAAEDYEWRVQETDGTNTSAFSAWSGFTAAPPAYNLEWRDVATQTTTVVTGITDLFYDLTGLTENTGYEFRVQEDDGSTTSAFTAWTGFTTAAAATGVRMTISEAMGASDSFGGFSPSVYTLTIGEAVTAIDSVSASLAGLRGLITATITIEPTITGTITVS